ncbi:MAG: PLP-dependent aminotransferase family protein [Burkholderiaceae bacterium]
MTRYANRINRLQPSPIREILRVIDHPGMISFAGGLPDSASFPDISPVANRRDQTWSANTMQYGPTEGEQALREVIAEDFSKRAMPVSADQVLILSGSQQGIDLVSKLMIDEGTLIAVESPTYLAALQVFNLFGARFISYQSGSVAEDINSHGGNEAPAMIYSIPTFQNPTGHCYSLTERQQLAHACDDANTVLFEDDPYRALAYETCERQPVVSMLKSAPWVYQSSFSKELAPGLRLGYLICSPELYPQLVWLKQAADLHSNRLSQQLVLSMLTSAESENRLHQLQSHYRLKRDNFSSALERHFGDIATWSTPAGGLFFWLQLNRQPAIDTRNILPRAIDRKVAFMPGEPFYADGRNAANTLRLNFSHARTDEAEAGLKLLSQLIREVC